MTDTKKKQAYSVSLVRLSLPPYYNDSIMETKQKEHVQLWSEGKKGDNAVLSPELIANTYWQLHQQPANCWTQETHLAAQEAFGSIASI